MTPANEKGVTYSESAESGIGKQSNDFSEPDADAVAYALVETYQDARSIYRLMSPGGSINIEVLAIYQGIS